MQVGASKIDKERSHKLRPESPAKARATASPTASTAGLRGAGVETAGAEAAGTVMIRTMTSHRHHVNRGSVLDTNTEVVPRRQSSGGGIEHPEFDNLESTMFSTSDPPGITYTKTA